MELIVVCFINQWWIFEYFVDAAGDETGIFNHN